MSDDTTRYSHLPAGLIELMPLLPSRWLRALMILGRYISGDFQLYRKQNYVAEKAGMARSTFCTVLGELAEVGIIMNFGRQRVTKPDGSGWVRRTNNFDWADLDNPTVVEAIRKKLED